jgi:DNA-directed RNA polymerase specialized sigma24 family protein
MFDQTHALGAPTARLVTEARAGNEIAWAELVDRYTPLLWALARRHPLEQANAADVVQLTWLRLADHLNHIRDADGVPAWLVTTCLREAKLAARLNSYGPAPLPTDRAALT